MRHVLSAEVENKPGVLSRIAGLFSRRGFNIESLNVAPTQDPTVSRITAVVEADDEVYEQITKQLHKLINVIKISDMAKGDSIQRETMFVNVRAAADQRKEIMDTVSLLKAKAVDVGLASMVVECTGDSEKLDDLLSLLRPYGIIDIVRTGIIAVPRSPK